MRFAWGIELSERREKAGKSAGSWNFPRLFAVWPVRRTL